MHFLGLLLYTAVRNRTDHGKGVRPGTTTRGFTKTFVRYKSLSENSNRSSYFVHEYRVQPRRTSQFTSSGQADTQHTIHELKYYIDRVNGAG